jgi:hypothetical protein
MHDVFISYSHTDDVPPSGLPKGWVTTFVDELEKELNKKSDGGPVSLWRDKDLASNERVKPTLLDAVRASRTLVLFLSPTYQHSDWCQLELGAFLEANAATSNRESVFIVEVEPVDRDEWHPRLRELTQIRLWTTGSRGAPRRLGHPLPKLEEENPYWERLNELAHLITSHLDRSAAPRPVSTSAVYPGDRPTAWLAEPSEDVERLFDRWDEVAFSLRQAGWNVRPSGSRSYDRRSTEEFQQAVERDLDASRLFVQLLSSSDANREACRFALLQAEAARNQAQERDLPFVQWLPQETRLDLLHDADYRRLAAGVVTSPFEMFRVSLFHIARGLLSGPPPPVPQATATEGDRALAICVNAEPLDRDLGEEVVEILTQLGADSLVAPDPGQQPSADYLALLDEVITGTEGTIIVYGKCSPVWVQAQYLRAHRILSPTRRGLWGAVVEGPPEGKPRPGVSSRSIMTLDWNQGARTETIAQFVEGLRKVVRA